jgi:3-hydroxy-9,10-secoandrosta-1,3,5(10)-triene-9,17-dione monooxygenase
MPTITREGDAGTTEALLQKARALAPKLRARAEATGKARRIPEETIQDFWDAGLWYLLKPKKFGGPELRRTSRCRSPTSFPAPTARPAGSGR